MPFEAKKPDKNFSPFKLLLFILIFSNTFTMEQCENIHLKGSSEACVLI